MPTFIVEQYETWVQSYSVEADSEEEAIEQVLGGRGLPIDLSFEFLQPNEDIGTTINGKYFPSISSVEKE